MSRSDDDDQDDDERPRKRRRDDDDESDDGDEEEESSLGGWRPLGEAVFWGTVFLGLTLVAFSLGEGIGVKRPLAHKEPDPEKTESVERQKPEKKVDDTAFVTKIDPLPPDEDPDRKIDLGAPPKPNVEAAPAKVVSPPIDEPTTRLAWQSMLAKSQVTFKTKPKPVLDDGPTRRTDFEAMIRQVELQPATQRLNASAMLKEVRLAPSTRRLDWESMVRSVDLEPATRRLDVDGMVRQVTFIPRPKVTAPIAAAAVPSSIQLREIPSRLQVGKIVVLAAKVLDANGLPLADQPVEWTLDRQGVGEIVAASTDARLAKPSERPMPIFARTFTAKAAHRIDAALGAAEIGVGETWIAVQSASAGGMHASVQAPGVASHAAGRTGAHFHWDRATATFPEPIAAQAGAEAAVVTRVASNEPAAAPLPDYRVRYTVTDAGGVELPNGDGVIEVQSRGDGRATASFKQRTISVGATRGKIELLGRSSLPGRGAEVLAAGDFTINWIEPGASITPSGPARGPVGEWVRIAATPAVKHPGAAQNLRVFATPSEDLQLQSGSANGTLDLGAWPNDGKSTDVAVRRERAGKGTIRFEVRQGAHVWASATHAMEFESPKGVPSLRLAISDSVDPTPLGGELDYHVVIENQGSAPARQVRVEFAAPVGFEFVSAVGSLGGAVKDGKYAPAAIEELAPGAKTSAKVRVKSLVKGDVRLVVRINHPSITQGTIEEFEGTVVYQP